MRARHLTLGVVLAASVGLVIFGDTQPADLSEPVVRPAISLPDPKQARELAPSTRPVILSLHSRAQHFGDTKASDGGGPDAFASTNWTPPPPLPAPTLPPPPPPRPAAPPLPFTCIGKTLEEGKWAVFLARDERTFVVHEKDVIDGSYRVDSIRPPYMTLNYLPLGQVQQLDIGGFD